MQINAGSLLGDYGKTVKKTAKKFIKRNMVHILGSDGHNITSRKTRLKEAYEIVKGLNETLYDWIFQNATNIINNVSMMEFLELKLKKRKISFFDIFK